MNAIERIRRAVARHRPAPVAAEAAAPTPAVEPPSERAPEHAADELRQPLLPFPPGHFYSPIVDPATLDAERLWPANPHVLGIDFNDASHRAILTGDFPRFHPDYDYADTLPDTPDLTDFYTGNSQFSGLDPRLLFVLLRACRPRRLLEVGSGYSSLLVADVNRRFLGNALDVTCIEPYPRPFLARGIAGITRLVQARVQDIDMAAFEALESGDVLFIDSSHVAKTGSDVNHLFFEVLPRLARGVLVHIHDIFLPHEYPREWVIAENRSWNEQYVLRALLLGGSAYEVVFGSAYACTRFPDLVVAALDRPDRALHGGGSFWMRKR
jgi:hypothetical protein